jgi:hypothetical protein
VADRLIYLRENQRRVTRGISFNAQRDRYELDMEEGETKTVTIDCSGILATSETVSTATVENEGITCTASVSSPQVTLTLSALTNYGTGNTTVTITLSGGTIFKLRLRARSVRNYRYYDYYTGLPA